MNRMAQCRLSLLLFYSCYLAVAIHASAGDADPLYSNCVEQCQKTGCKFSSDGKPMEGPWYLQEPMYLQWKQWDCLSECRYNCMLTLEKKRNSLGGMPVKYHGKWPFQRVYGMQEPVSVALSALNLAMQFHGWVSFFVLVNYKLPLRPNKSTYYEYTGLLHVYAIFAMNSWLWSAVFHTRDVDLTEKLDYSSAVALLGYSLLLAVLRAFNVRLEAARVMVAAPIIAFVTTHILYLNLYELDYGWNMKICLAMGIAQLLVWGIWAVMSRRHPSRWKLLVVVMGSSLAMLLEIYDFPPYEGFVDAHALWHATTVPLTYIWWSFIKDDAQFCTTNLIKKTK
ncbi:post-GPI attachment to proteins factor 3-like isoform X2 [Impatiens glandulifera]|uniref:post-GPI attachment to proteins factor 3-like isoform X1 n=1 Tax=Impatiens glandulifera TaxID=253017 RepID=UPI001FB0C9AA|nr:post-GPI attachment to proteins factor 3-like isoform X1 [Impatiens glandulifera]XP_047324755.1 post-GPI attachment to proteins factor 3-like isoform X2 [Impatiens glandulifera]